MYKIWCSNNLSTIGKWSKIFVIFGIIFADFIFQENISVHAYVLETTTPSVQSQQVELNLNSISKINTAVSLSGFVDSALKSLGLNQSINITTETPASPIKESPRSSTDLSKFFSSSKVSYSDIIDFLRSAIVTAINLTILVISVTAQVLKGLLSVFQ